MCSDGSNNHIFPCVVITSGHERNKDFGSGNRDAGERRICQRPASFLGSTRALQSNHLCSTKGLSHNLFISLVDASNDAIGVTNVVGPP